MSMKSPVFVLLVAATLSLRTFPLLGNSTIGYYFLEAYIGTPPQRKTLIVDTGSHLTIFPCSPCKQCRDHMTPSFVPSKSTSFEPLVRGKRYFNWSCEEMFANSKAVCEFNQGYTEGSRYDGFLAKDQFRFQNELEEKQKDFSQIFGCAETETGEFYTQEVDGIIGFGVKRDSSYSPDALEIEYNEKRIASTVFSICLAPNGGVMTLGGMNKDQHLSDSQTTVIDSSKYSWGTQYIVSLDEISIEGEKVSYDFSSMNSGQGSAFLDSGTTLVYFDNELFKQWKTQFVKFCGRDHKNCGGYKTYNECFSFDASVYNSMEEFIASFPKINFVLGGKDWAWLPENYLLPALDSLKELCVGVKQLKNAILGAVFMRNYDVLFDREKRTISFTKSKCGETVAVAGSPKTTGTPSSGVPSVTVKEPEGGQRNVSSFTWNWVLGGGLAVCFVILGLAFWVNVMWLRSKKESLKLEMGVVRREAQ